jgi:hypothetical protein
MHRRGAIAAGAAKDDVVAGDGVARPAFDLPEGAFQLIVGERLHLAAVVADEVVVVLAARVDRLEACGAGADVDALDEAVLAQLLENAVNAGDPDAAAFRAQLVEDLLRGQAAVLAPEQLDHRAAGAAVSVALCLQRRNRRLGPRARRGRSVHGR